MDRTWCYVLFLVWFSFLTVTQVLLFTNGFLLSRAAQFKNSSCVQIGDLDCSKASEETSQCDKISEWLIGLENSSTTCLPPKSKVILLIIDAFRYDFAVYNESLTAPLPYQNKLPVVTDLLRSHADRTRLYKFIADPPTTTMQRLKGLTTGSLPTFIDAGSNFATNEINEDNIIDQVNNMGFEAVFLGDDTWNGLYPNRFKRNYPFPSFNVWDLDTVDYGIMKKLSSEIAKGDWKLLIGHFLGVDHCGHRYGPNHSEMERKLREMNEVIRKVVDEMDDGTTLFVIGDHGMTSTGDHGGESENEITAAMFVHSKLKLSEPYYDHNNTVKQVDLIPSLAAILGVPVPYSNLGSVVYDVIPVSAFDSNQPNWYYLLFHGWSNVQQLTVYIREYSANTDTFDAEKLEEVYERFSELNAKLFHVQNEAKFRDFAADIHGYVKYVRTMCEEVWIQFDAFNMARGLLLISHVSILTFLLVESYEEFVSFSFICACYAAVAASAVIGFALYFSGVVAGLVDITYFVCGLSGVCTLAFVTVQNFQAIAEKLYENTKSRRWTDILCRIVIAFSGLMLFSNSFILEEARVMLFFLLTIVLVGVVDFVLGRVSKRKDVSFKGAPKIVSVIFVVVCLLIRFSSYFWRCREEQGCDNSVFTKGGSSGNTQWMLSTIFLSLFVTGTRMWLRSCGNLNGASFAILLARYMPTVSVVCSAGFWILHKLPKDTKTKLLGPWQPDMLAWVVYLLCAAGIIGTIMQPLYVYQLLKKSGIEVDTSTSNFIPQLAKHVFANRAVKKSQEPPTVFGLATVYSSAFVAVAVNLVLLWTLLLGDLFVPSSVSLVIVVALVLVIVSIHQYENAQKPEDLLQPSSISLLFWFVMSVYLFYGTGHQPSFPNIAWDAAFVGTGGKFVHNFVPAALVIFNTFGSQIIMGFSLPLVLIAPFSLYVMFPGLFGRKAKPDLSRGEMILYDHQEALLSNTFKLCTKYVLCYTLRVFCSMLAATIHCRHLMVWNIFAPKLIFEAVGLFVTLASVVFGYLLLVRTNFKLNHFIGCLNKQYS